MLTLYAQAPNTSITSQTYHKSSSYVILGNSCFRYCFVYKLHDRIEYGLIKTSLISGVSYFNLGGWSFIWGAKLTKAPRIDGTEFRLLCDSVVPLLGYGSTGP